MSISVASRKAKGRALQQWVCNRLSEISGIPWGSNDEDEIRSRTMGLSGVDVILTGAAKERFPFSFECKSGESFQFVSSIEQARKNETPDRPWVLVHRRKKFRNPIVLMDWSTFEKLIKDDRNV